MTFSTLNCTWKESCKVTRCRRKLSKSRSPDFETCTGWTQEWLSPKLLQNEDLKIREIVRGPFASPKLLKIRPYIVVSSSCAENERKNSRRERLGIPDTWHEYLSLQGFCDSKDSDSVRKNLISCCVRRFVTDSLWNEMGLPLTQGIPDPSRNAWPYPRTTFVEQSRGRCVTKRPKVCNVINYDGDDEMDRGRKSKKERRFKYVKCADTNEERVRKDTAQPCRNKSDFPIPDQEIFQRKSQGDDNARKETKKNRYRYKKFLPREPKDKSDKPVLDRETSLPKFEVDVKVNDEGRANGKKSASEKKKKKSRHSIPDGKLLLRKQKCDLNVKSSIARELPATSRRDTSVQTDNVAEAKGTEQPHSFAIEKFANKKERIPLQTFGSHELPAENCTNQNDRRFLGGACCNCTLRTQSCVAQNMNYFADNSNRFKGLDLSDRVLCGHCESIYRGNASRGLDLEDKPTGFCIRDITRNVKEKTCLTHEDLYKWTKQKVCFCFQKARQGFQALNVPIRVEEKSTKTVETTESDKEMKLICCRCDCPYLKIATVHGDAIEQRTCPSIREKRDKQQKQQNGRHDHSNDISRCRATLKEPRHAVRNSADYYCTRTGSKAQIFVQGPTDLEQSKDRKSRSDVSNEVIENNNCAEETTRYPRRDNRPYPEDNDANKGFQADARKDNSNKEMRRAVCCVGRADETRSDRANERRIESGRLSDNGDDGYSDDNGVDEEEKGVKYWQRNRSDNNTTYVTSDSGERADISDVTESVNIDDTSYKKPSVTSMTLIHRLENSMASTIRRRRAKRKPRNKCNDIHPQLSSRNTRNVVKTAAQVIANHKLLSPDDSYQIRKIVNCTPGGDFSTGKRDNFPFPIVQKNGEGKKGFGELSKVHSNPDTMRTKEIQPNTPRGVPLKRRQFAVSKSACTKKHDSKKLRDAESASAVNRDKADDLRSKKTVYLRHSSIAEEGNEQETSEYLQFMDDRSVLDISARSQNPRADSDETVIRRSSVLVGADKNANSWFRVYDDDAMSTSGRKDSTIIQDKRAFNKINVQPISQDNCTSESNPENCKSKSNSRFSDEDLTVKTEGSKRSINLKAGTCVLNKIDCEVREASGDIYATGPPPENNKIQTMEHFNENLSINTMASEENDISTLKDADCITDTSEYWERDGNTRKLSKLIASDNEIVLEERNRFITDNASERLSPSETRRGVTPFNAEKPKEKVYLGKNDNCLHVSKQRRRKIGEWASANKETIRTINDDYPGNLRSANSERLVSLVDKSKIGSAENVNCTRRYDNEFDRTMNIVSFSNTETSS